MIVQFLSKPMASLYDVIRRARVRNEIYILTALNKRAWVERLWVKYSELIDNYYARIWYNQRVEIFNIDRCFNPQGIALDGVALLAQLSFLFKPFIMHYFASELKRYSSAFPSIDKFTCKLTSCVLPTILSPSLTLPVGACDAGR